MTVLCRDPAHHISGPTPASQIPCRPRRQEVFLHAPKTVCRMPLLFHLDLILASDTEVGNLVQPVGELSRPVTSVASPRLRAA